MAQSRARGIIGVMVDDFDAELFGNAMEAAQKIIATGYASGRPETIANNIKKACYRNAKAYGYQWANVPRIYSDEQAALQFRRIMSVNILETILSRFWRETLDERCIEALETTAQNFAKYTEEMVEMNVLEDRIERDEGKKGEK